MLVFFLLFASLLSVPVLTTEVSSALPAEHLHVVLHVVPGFLSNEEAISTPSLLPLHLSSSLKPFPYVVTVQTPVLEAP